MRRYAWLVIGLLFLPACQPVALLNASVTRAGYHVKEDIAYGPGERRKLDIYRPDGVSAPAPVVLFFYGGNWQQGSKEDYLFVGQALASQGFVVVIADYRLYPDVYFPAFVEDGAQAVRWVHEHIGAHGGDAANLFLMGHSAGAQIAALLSVDERYLKAAGGLPAWLRGFIGLAGPYDFLPLTEPELVDLFSQAPLAESQPITFVKKKKPPMLLAYGEEDSRVRPKNTQAMAQALRQAGSSVEVHAYPAVGHVGIILALAQGFRGNAPVLTDISSFVKAQSK